MTGASKTIAKHLCWGAGLCLAGLLLSGVTGCPDFVGIAFALGMVGSMLGAFVFALGYAVHLRIERREYLGRVPLSDEEFAAKLPSSEQVRPEVVRRVRELAAKRFRRIGGDRFYPNDRLEDDLHIFDSAPWAFDDFEYDLRQEYGELDEDEMAGLCPPETFGDVILIADRAFLRGVSQSQREQESVP